MEHKLFWQGALFPVVQQHRGHNTLGYSWCLIKDQVDQTAPPFLMKIALHWDINIMPSISPQPPAIKAQSHWGIEESVSVQPLATVQSKKYWPETWVILIQIGAFHTRAGTEVWRSLVFLFLQYPDINLPPFRKTHAKHKTDFLLQMHNNPF